MIFIDRKSAESGLADILTAMANGFRFDSRVSLFVILPSFLLSIIAGFFPLNKIVDRVRYVIAVTFTVLTLFACGATIPFFKEYDDQFNQWVLGLIFDDFNAIAQTIWAQVPVVPILLTAVVLTVAAAFLLKWMLNSRVVLSRRAEHWSMTVKITITICLLFLMVAAGRGSVGRRPVELKDVAVTRDNFLNKCVINPYEALRYILEDYKQFNRAQGIQAYLPDGDIRSAVKSYFNDSRDLNDIDQYMKRTCTQENINPPRHIFLIVMEGYDIWPMLDQYQSMQLCPQLKALAQKGIWIRRFLPASVGTTPALTSIMSGLPDAHVMTNYQPSSRNPYPSSIAPIFKALGYKTRFFYGGYLSWQHIGEFARNQGFEEIYGAPHMGKWVHSNEWGVNDEALFKFIEKTVSKDQPSFSMIMTTTYHPPYDKDVFGMGFPTKTIPPDLAGIYDGEIKLKIFGHLWYADKSLGEFVRQIEQSLEKPLFAITADHWSRKYLNSKPSLYERSAVPCVLYGPEVLSGKNASENRVGCHTDIGPTLIENCAPKGFTYHGVGRNLLSEPLSPAAVGAQGIIIGPGFIMDKHHPDQMEPIPGYLFQPADAEIMVRMANRYYAIGWWRIMRGASLP